MAKGISTIYLMGKVVNPVSKYDRNGEWSQILDAGSIILGRVGYYNEATDEWDTGDLTVLAKYDGEGSEIIDWESEVPVTLTNFCIFNFYDLTLSDIRVFTEPTYSLDTILSLFKQEVRNMAISTKKLNEYNKLTVETSDESETI